MRHAALLLFMLFSASLMAEEVTLEPVPERQPTARTFLLGIGRTNQLDTYLSPMEYKGTQVSFLTQSERMTHLAQRHISFQGGALIGTDLGFLYNDRNGNNPAQGQFSLDLSLSAGGAYSFHLRKLPMRASYQADLPMLGMMFCPEFGESYYEISQKGAGHDLLCAHPGNALSFRQMLMLDFCLRRITLRVGYLNDVRQRNAHGLKYHDFSHSFMFGIVRHFRELRIRK